MSCPCRSCFDCPVHLSGPSCPTLDASLSCPFCHVLGVGFSLSVQPNLFRLTLFFQATLSRLTCSSCLFLTVLPKLSYAGCPATIVLSRLSSPSPVLADMFWPSSNLCLFQADMIRLLSGQPVQIDLTWLSCPSYPVPAVITWLSCP
jgi:hypothetical protein